MIYYRERLILMYLYLNDNKFQIPKLCDILEISDRTLRRSLEILKSNLLKLDKSCDIYIDKDNVVLKYEDLKIKELISINEVYSFSKLEMQLIITNSLINSTITNSNSLISYFQISKQQFTKILDELSIIFLKQNIIIENVNGDLVLNNKNEIGTKRVQYYFLKKYFELLPEYAIANFRSFLPAEIANIISIWIDMNIVKKTYLKISGLFSEKGVFNIFYNILDICTILVLWMNIKENYKILDNDKITSEDIIDKYYLYDYERDLINDYFIFSNKFANENSINFVDKLIKEISLIYKPFNDEVVESLKKDLYQIILTFHKSNFVSNVEDEENLIKINEIVVEQLKKTELQNKKELSQTLSINIYYWLFEQATKDPFKLLFIQNANNVINNYYLTLITNTFCCIDLQIINLYEFNANIVNEFDVIISQIIFETKFDNLIYISDSDIVESKSIILEIPKLLIKTHLDNYDK